VFNSKSKEPYMIRVFPLPLLLCTLFLTFAAQADPRVARIFGDNMVLQRDRPVPVWGWAEPGEAITVTANAMSTSTVTDASGKWRVDVGPFSVGEPFGMSIVGKQTVEFSGILAGEVWICSGQSNMEWPVSRAANPQEERTSADYPLIRHVKIQNTTSLTPLDDIPNTGWQVCSESSVGSFTAVGYFFGRHLHKELNVPIGLINTSWGGTIVETWISSETLVGHVDFSERVNAMAECSTNAAAMKALYDTQMAAWQIEFNKALEDENEQWQVAELDDQAWAQMHVPGNWEKLGLPDLDGKVWFRKTVTIPQAWDGLEVGLSLAKIDDIDTTWVNGVRVGGLSNWNTPRNYVVPASLVKAGPMTIAVRVYDTGGGGGFHGNDNEVKLTCSGQEPISLAGDWRYKVSSTVTVLPPKPASPPGSGGPNHPTVLFNAMVNPIVPYGVRGAIWYQGESNASRGYQYRSLFPLLIEDWRKQWDADLSFYFVQLANFMQPNEEPMSSAWAELRESQSMTLSLPKTGQAVIIDLGEASDIHPRNKQDVGYRLALHALAKDYGQDALVHSGPIYTSMKTEDGKIRLTFEHVGGGLIINDGEALTRFAIAGSDQKFVWADAVVDGNEVVVSCEEVPEPVAVRYAWANNPEGCNFYNKEGLPASPFRTDDWPGVTVNNH
jgi:sialate O-acetylesterase